MSHKLAEKPEAREAQRTLAEEMTRLTHGETALDSAKQASKALFGGDISGLSAMNIQEIFTDVPSTTVNKTDFEGIGMSIADLLVAANVTKSKGEARRSIRGGGIYLNNIRVADENRLVPIDDAIEGKFLVLRKGKRHYNLVKVIG